jgi:hypothetical protein
MNSVLTVCRGLLPGQAVKVRHDEMLDACTMFLSSRLFDSVRDSDIKEKLVPFLQNNFGISCTHNLESGVWVVHKI